MAAIARLLTAEARQQAAALIRRNHYTHTIPSGKSVYCAFEDALVIWSIPANKNIAAFLLGWKGTVWELARLWAPDGHAKNLLTQTISAAVRLIVSLERPDVLVSYADPTLGHTGGVYRAASWIYHGQSEEARNYINAAGERVARRAFHSGGRSLTKAQIEALGWREVRQPGKLRFVRPISTRARRAVQARMSHT